MLTASEEEFEGWRHHPVTKRLMRMLLEDRDAMKEGLVNNAFTDEQEVKGRCRAIAVLLTLEYQDLYGQPKESGAYEQ